MIGIAVDGKQCDVMQRYRRSLPSADHWPDDGQREDLACGIGIVLRAGEVVGGLIHNHGNWRSDVDDGQSGSLTSERDGELLPAFALAVAISFLYILVLH